MTRFCNDIKIRYRNSLASTNVRNSNNNVQVKTSRERNDDNKSHRARVISISVTSFSLRLTIANRVHIMEVLILVCQDDPNQHFVIVVAAERAREHEYPSSLFLATLL